MPPNQHRLSETGAAIQTLPPSLQARAAQIKLPILDIDGVLTDDRISIRDNGEEIKLFSILDGHGLEMPQAGGVQVAVITGRNVPLVSVCIQQLDIRYCFKGTNDERATYTELRKQAGVEEHEYAYVGDDVVDLPVMVRCSLPVAVPDTYWSILRHATYIIHHRGGRSAVCEARDLVMRTRDTLGVVLSEYAG